MYLYVYTNNLNAMQLWTNPTALHPRKGHIHYLVKSYADWTEVFCFAFTRTECTVPVILCKYGWIRYTLLHVGTGPARALLAMSSELTLCLQSKQLSMHMS